ncbi:MAG TPA: YqaJ viral recombinase family protein [Asticcacaulis sp.]|nr:YqaJ viral recombinase family protein [Asticcacaulis sp.]
MEQQSPEWFAARLGRATASRIADIMAKTKTGPSASRANYMAELIAERLTGTPAERFQNAAMQWGTDNEDAARQQYSFQTELEVDTCGFVGHPSIEMAGASPDGLISEDGLVEIKCPNTATHIDTLLSGKVPDKYVIQMLWQMACTGRKWCDFVSFDPRLPSDMRIFIRRVHFDAERVAEMEREVIAFLSEVETKITELQAVVARAA